MRDGTKDFKPRKSPSFRSLSRALPQTIIRYDTMPPKSSQRNIIEYRRNGRTRPRTLLEFMPDWQQENRRIEAMRNEPRPPMVIGGGEEFHINRPDEWSDEQAADFFRLLLREAVATNDDPLAVHPEYIRYANWREHTELLITTLMHGLVRTIYLRLHSFL